MRLVVIEPIEADHAHERLVAGQFEGLWFQSSLFARALRGHHRHLLLGLYLVLAVAAVVPRTLLAADVIRLLKRILAGSTHPLTPLLGVV